MNIICEQQQKQIICYSNLLTVQVELCTLNSCAVRAAGVHVDEELVTDSAVGREPSTEAEYGEHLVTVVVLDDGADGCDRLLVAVWRRPDVVQRVWLRRVPVGSWSGNAIFIN